MICIHIISDHRTDPPAGICGGYYFDFEILTAPDTCDNVLYRCTLDRPTEFTKLYGVGKGRRPGVAARGNLRQAVAAALPQLFKVSAPFIMIPDI